MLKAATQLTSGLEVDRFHSDRLGRMAVLRRIVYEDELRRWTLYLLSESLERKWLGTPPVVVWRPGR